jgi:hypothetical protein
MTVRNRSINGSQLVTMTQYRSTLKQVTTPPHPTLAQFIIFKTIQLSQCLPSLPNSSTPSRYAARLLLASQLTIQTRRTIYQLTNKSPLSDDQLKTLVEEAVKHAPTSFNMQQSRAVLVTGDMHHKVWDSVIENYTKSFKDDGEYFPPSSLMERGVHRRKRDRWKEGRDP